MNLITFIDGSGKALIGDRVDLITAYRGAWMSMVLPPCRHASASSAVKLSRI